MGPMTFVCITKLAMDLAIFLAGIVGSISAQLHQIECAACVEFPDLVEKPRVRVETENFLPEKLMMECLRAR